jgi:hypothetical protein
LRWLESVEEDIKNMGLRNWRCKRTKKSGGQFWKTLNFTKDWNARKRSRTGRRRRSKHQLLWI